MLQLVVHSCAHYVTTNHLMLVHAHCLMAALDTQYSDTTNIRLFYNI